MPSAQLDAGTIKSSWSDFSRPLQMLLDQLRSLCLVAG